MLKRRSLPWPGLARCLALGLLLLLAPPRAGWAMEIAIPEEIQKLPPERQTQWLNQQFRDAAQLQKKVAQERFDAREETRRQMIQSINEASASRTSQIEDAQKALQEREDEAGQDQTIVSGLLGALLVVCLAALLYKRWRAASEPITYY